MTYFWLFYELACYVPLFHERKKNSLTEVLRERKSKKEEKNTALEKHFVT